MATTTDRPTERATDSIAVENPATGQVVATLKAHTPEQVAEMAARARLAQPAWHALGFDGRGKILRRMQKWLLDNADRVADTLKMSRPDAEALVAGLATANLVSIRVAGHRTGAQQRVSALNDLQGLSKVVPHHADECRLKFLRGKAFRRLIGRRGDKPFYPCHGVPLFGFGRCIKAPSPESCHRTFRCRRSDERMTRASF